MSNMDLWSFVWQEFFVNSIADFDRMLTDIQFARIGVCPLKNSSRGKGLDHTNSYRPAWNMWKRQIQKVLESKRNGTEMTINE